MPLIDRVTAEQVEIFVIPTHKQRRERPVFQPVQPLLFGIAAIPDAAEVPVIPNSGQRRLYRKKYYPEIFYIALKMQ